MSLIFSNLVVIKTLSSNHRMYNLYAKFVKILEICKQFSENLVNDSGNVPRRGPVPKFSDLEVVALSLTAETESIDSEKWLFDYKLQEYKDSIPNLISRRQFNDRRKKTSGLCEELRKRIAMEMFVKNPAYKGSSDEYDFYFCDRENHCIRILTPQGRVTTFAGRGSNGTSGYNDGDLRQEARFNHPEGIVYDEERECFFIGGRENRRIRKIGYEE